MARTKISDIKDLSVYLKIKSYQNGYLFLPKEEEWGYLRQHSGFFSIQVQRKSGQKYTDIPEGAHIDNYPMDAVDTLRLGDVRSYKFSMQRLYHYFKGKYRVRVLVNFSFKNKAKDKYVEGGLDPDSKSTDHGTTIYTPYKITRIPSHDIHKPDTQRVIHQMP